MNSAAPITPPFPSAPAAGVQFSVRDLVMFSAACAFYLGWMRFLMSAVATPPDPDALAMGRAPNPHQLRDVAFGIALCYWPMPLALMGLLPRRNPGEAAPGLSGHALWRLAGVLYPACYLAASVLLFPKTNATWPILFGATSLTAAWLMICGALILWECGGSNLPKTRVEWLGRSLYLYLLFGGTASVLLALAG